MLKSVKKIISEWKYHKHKNKKLIISKNNMEKLVKPIKFKKSKIFIKQTMKLRKNKNECENFIIIELK